MNIKTQQILNAPASLQTLNTTALPLRVSIKLAQNLKNIEEVMKEYEKRRMALLENYGKQSEDGQRYEFETDENRIKWHDAHTSLIEEEVDITLFKIKFEDIPSEQRISAMDLSSIEWVFVETFEEIINLLEKKEG